MPTERADRKAPGKDATPKWTLVIPNKFVKLVSIRQDANYNMSLLKRIIFIKVQIPAVIETTVLKY